MSQYFEHPSLTELYLEDSFVLDLKISPGQATLSIEVVLRENHDEYVPPGEDEQYCYRRALFQYSGVQSSTWRMPTRPPATDETGEIDYGGIEQYTITENRHHLVGEIGEVLITCSDFVVELLPKRPVEL